MQTTPGQRLRRGRERQRKTQEQIAQQIHKSASTYKKWEQDRACPKSYADIITVCAACGISVQEFITGERHIQGLADQQLRLLRVLDQFSDQGQEVVLAMLEQMLQERR